MSKDRRSTLQSNLLFFYKKRNYYKTIIGPNNSHTSYDPGQSDLQRQEKGGIGNNHISDCEDDENQDEDNSKFTHESNDVI